MTPKLALTVDEIELKDVHCTRCHRRIGRCTPTILFIGSIYFFNQFHGKCTQCSNVIRWTPQRPVIEDEGGECVATG